MNLPVLSLQIKDTREKTNRIDESGEKVGLRNNINEDSDQKKRVIENWRGKLEEVEQVTCLGSVVNKIEDTDKDINARNCEALTMSKPGWKSIVLSDIAKIKYLTQC